MIGSGMETTLSIPGRVEVARSDHRRIFAAIAAHDDQAAAAAMRDHISGARQGGGRPGAATKRWIRLGFDGHSAI